MESMEFEKLVKSRRSAVKFVPNVQVTATDLNEIFGLVKYAPSCFNLQHTHYYVVKEQSKKEKLREFAHGQYKVSTASAVIVVFGDPNAHKNAEDIYDGMKALGLIDDQEYKEMIVSINGMYESRGESFRHDEAVRNASLSAMLFMLAAKDKGWDTCPMIGFDSEKVHEYLGAPTGWVPMLMIALGKADTSKVRARGYRKPVNRFVTYF